ncbi:MAG: terminase, partial [Ignavibacteria bacterium]|nr:terminase [Ignavibacteria bacterium]
KMPMKSPDQIKYVKNLILDYNGKGNPDYENIIGLMLDSGAGGGGVNAWADNILEDWQDSKGVTHKGFIDDKHEIYQEEAKNYPRASRVLSLINPKKFRNQMCEELIELLDLDLIKFTKEYNGKSFVTTSEMNSEGEIEFKDRKLTLEEEISLVNIDIMKTETTSIHKIKDDQGNVVKYALPKESERNAHDDRFYVLLLLAHKLYEIRRTDLVKKPKKKQDFSSLFLFRQPQIRKF